MCGICFAVSLNNNDFNFSKWLNDSGIKNLLRNRGPDACNDCLRTLEISKNNVSLDLNFFASVLSMRGDQTVVQPITNDSGDVLLFNGEIYSGLNLETIDYSSINDGLVLFEILSKFSSDDKEIKRFIENIEGPRSFIYFSMKSKRLWINRDFFGRCSLLWAIDKENQRVYCSSVKPLNSDLKWTDVPTGVLISIDLNSYLSDLNNTQISTTSNVFEHFFTTEFHTIVSNEALWTLNKQLAPQLEDNQMIFDVKENKDDDFYTILMDHLYEMHKSYVQSFLNKLKEAVKRRLNCMWKRLHQVDLDKGQNETKLAVLFSGGVDSLLLTVLVDEIWPKNETIDLFSVAFEQQHNNNNNAKGYKVPDRITGLGSFSEMKAAAAHLDGNSHGRHWNFIEINVTRNELAEYRKSRIANLLYPCQTVLDDSIGCALWFAARGRGLLDGVPYSSTARAIIVGSGADELLAGYSRHRSRFQESGSAGLIEELEMELARLSIRNLSRDDRVLSDHGREPHAPYLDETFVVYCNSLPLNIKTNLNLPRGIGEKLILRLALYSLGFRRAVSLPKRAIQFGSRIAKAENSKERGNDKCSRLL